MSGTFLYVIAALNVVILFGIIKVFREMQTGRFDEAALERQLDSRGLDEPVPRPVDQDGHQAAADVPARAAVRARVRHRHRGRAAGDRRQRRRGAGLPWYAILCLPILFAAGMSLLDSIDGSFMNFAYGWAFSKPVRKVFYNITITGLSVAVALVIGTIELGGLIAAAASASRGSFWGWFESIDLNVLGFIIVGDVPRHLGRSRWRSGTSDASRSAGPAHLEPCRQAGSG